MAAGYYSAPNLYIIGIMEKEDTAFYVLNKGMVSVTKKQSFLRTMNIATLSRGDYFGEISLLNNVPASGSVKTLTDSEIFILLKNDFKQLLKNNPALNSKIQSVIAKREFEIKISE